MAVLLENLHQFRRLVFMVWSSFRKLYKIYTMQNVARVFFNRNYFPLLFTPLTILALWSDTEKIASRRRLIRFPSAFLCWCRGSLFIKLHSPEKREKVFYEYFSTSISPWRLEQWRSYLTLMQLFRENCFCHDCSIKVQKLWLCCWQVGLGYND